MNSQNFIVKWKSLNHAFMYGSVIKKGSVVQFTNHQTPAGIVLNEWRMTADYYSEKTAPDLPFLKRNKRYTFYFNYEAVPKQSVYFKISFYRRNETLIETKVVQEREIQVEVPDDYYSYTIHMMSAAVQHMNFESIVITGAQISVYSDEIDIQSYL
ncbi:accessory Sec system protein Asp3 [Macrococcoides canis]|uniref:Accessory Sec system protein Asp3 n=1 Tax=Macrococcoides canis TaxID=1855823 RepID=A0A1W7AE95_9STAP|nr:accessory Sec system protein Asp3 [Macrococcus canis]ARQ07914.1 Accessory Sec system protein Asp3 [Macrococcus canis]